MVAELGFTGLRRHQHSLNYVPFLHAVASLLKCSYHFSPQPKASFFRIACPQSDEEIENEVRQVFIVS